jgi:hypothetical protein
MRAVRVLDDLLVLPLSTAFAAPYRSPNQATGDGSPRNKDAPEMPGIPARLNLARVDD